MQRKQGRMLGYICIGGGISFAVYGFQSEQPGTGLLACAVLVGIGAWLLNRLYLADPEAIKEYRETLLRSPLSESLRKFSSSENILQFSSPEEVRSLLWREAQAAGTLLSPLINLYGTRNIRDFLVHGVVRKDELRDRMDGEARKALSFTTLWHSFRDNQLPHAVSVVGADIAFLRGLFFKEFDWVDESGQLIPSAPPSSVVAGTEVAAGTPLGVYPALVAYAEFVTDTLAIPKHVVSTIVESCPFAQRESLSELLNAGLMDLHRLRLVRPSWAEGKLLHELQVRSMDLWSAELQLGLKRLILSGLISPLCVAPLLTSGVPTTPSHRAAKETNVIYFIEYWREILEQHPTTIIDRRLANAMMATYCEFYKKKHEVDSKLQQLRRRAAASRANHQPHGTRAETSNNIDEIFNLPEAQALREKFETEQIDMHNAFCRDYAAICVQQSSQRGGGVSLKTNDFEFNVNFGQNRCPQM